MVCVACGWPLVEIDYLQNEMCGVCYAESTDGSHWERPDLGLVGFRGSRRNNLVAGPCGVPALNPRGGADERFMGLVEVGGRLHVTVSPDGLRWTRRPQPCLPFWADTNNQLVYDPDTDRYLALLRGCRAVKVHSDGLDAFASPNYPPLAEIGSITSATCQGSGKK